MVIKNGACACPPESPNRVPVNPITPIAPLVSVSSVNGQNGDVILKKLFFGDKEYNGSDDIRLTLTDLGLDGVEIYKKALPTKAKIIDVMEDAKPGETYYCKEDKCFYLSLGEGDYHIYPSYQALVDALDGVKVDLVLEKDITSYVNIGQIKKGDVIPAGTSFEEVFNLILGESVVPVEGHLYKGVSSEIPTSVDNLAEVDVDVNDLLENGYIYKNVNTNNQYVVIGIDKSLGISCYQISQNGFALGFTIVDTDEQYIYYLDTPTTDTGARYTCLFEED